MTHSVFELHQLSDEIQPPESGKESRVLTDDTDAKVVLFAFAAGDGLKEHSAHLPAIIQILKGNAAMTVGDEPISGKPGTWIQMAADTPHSIKAETPVVMLLTLMK
jgi:quercetin dioxygenase-like cupin family protein